MRDSASVRYAVVVCAASAMFTGCNGSASESSVISPATGLPGALLPSAREPSYGGRPIPPPTIERLFAANDDTVTVYERGASSPLLTIAAGVGAPSHIAFDSRRNVWVANGGPRSGNGTITKYPPGKNAISRTITKGIKYPESIAINKSNDLYVANEGGNDVTVYNDKGDYLRTISKGINGPVALAFDSLGRLYVASDDGNSQRGSVAVYNTTKNRLLYKIVDGIDIPNTLAIDTGNNLYVANGNNIEHSDNTVTVYAPGSKTPSRTISDGIDYPISLGFDGSGDLYVEN